MGSSNSGRAAADLQRLGQRFTAWRSRRAMGTPSPSAKLFNYAARR